MTGFNPEKAPSTPSFFPLLKTSCRPNTRPCSSVLETGDPSFHSFASLASRARVPAGRFDVGKDMGLFLRLICR